MRNFCPTPLVEQSDHPPIPLYSLIYKPRPQSPVFRDQLYKHFETVPIGDFEAFTNKLIQAGSTLEFLKYADSLFEILFVGGLLQPGGSYIDDGSPVCPWAIVNSKDPASTEELKKYIDVQNKLIRRYETTEKYVRSKADPCGLRYKYLQKPLEETALPGLLQYINRWPAAQKDKIAIAIGVLMAQGLATAACLQSLTKDHLVKNGTSSHVPPHVDPRQLKPTFLSCRVMCRCGG